MKYYDEALMSGIRKALEDEITHWPGVTSREMMGCLCYFRGKSFFAFLVTRGMVLTKLPPDDRKTLLRLMRAESFEMAGRSVKTWVQVPLKKPSELSGVLPFVKRSYEGISPGRT